MLTAVSRVALLSLAVMAGSCRAAAESPVDSAEAGDFLWSDIHFGIAQKFWYASFDSTPIVARVVIPPGSSTPVAQVSLGSSTSSKVMPITAASLGWKDWSFVASASPRTSFSNADSPNGKISRDEYDFSVSYTVLHSIDTKSSLGLLVDHKTADVRPITGMSATQLLGIESNARVSATLFGVSATSPVATFGQKDLYFYGNAAFGWGHTHFSTPLIPTADTRYEIAELGLSYPFGSVFSFQLGFRTQTFQLRHVPFYTLSTSSPGTILSTDSRNFESSTEGPIVAVTASF